MTILIDIDDTIENLCEEWCNCLNEKHGSCVNYEDVTEWDISKFFPNLTKEQVFEPLHTPEIWGRLKPKEGSVEFIKKLIDEGHDVYLCTSTDYRNICPKFELVIQRHFPYIKWDHVIVASKKQMIKADVLVDDAVHNLVNGCWYGILFDSPANRDADETEYGLIRCKDWSLVYKTINLILEEIDKYKARYEILKVDSDDRGIRSLNKKE